MALTRSLTQPLASRPTRPAVFVLGALLTLPAVAAGQRFPPFDPYNPSWSSVSVLPSARDPRRVEARIRFRWGASTEEAARTPVGFPAKA